MDACANGLPLKRVGSRAGSVRHAILHTSRSFGRRLFLFAGMLGCGFLSAHEVHGLTAGKTLSARETDTAAAVRFDGRADAEGFPVDEAWEKVTAVQFSSDWQGKNADPAARNSSAAAMDSRCSLLEISGALSQHDGFHGRRT